MKFYKNKKGFVLLLAVTLASIILSISLGVASIVSKEIKFGTSARAANDAFFAADNGVECALFSDKAPSSAFPVSGPAGAVTCASSAVSFTGTPPSSPRQGTGFYTFTLNNLGSTGLSCAKVTVFKDGDVNPPYITTTVISKGYNVGNGSCDSANPDRAEREIKVTY